MDFFSFKEWPFFVGFSTLPQDLEDLDGLLLLFEGGRWIWPGVREGFRRTLRLPANDSQVGVRNNAPRGEGTDQRRIKGMILEHLDSSVRENVVKV